MKAAALDRFGPPSVLTVHELPVPEPGPNEVLIAVETAGVGSWDASIRDGSWRKPGRPRFPLIPGTDGAGVAVADANHVARVPNAIDLKDAGAVAATGLKFCAV